MTDLASLLSRGYFPAKIPAPFKSHRLAHALASNSLRVPSQFKSLCASKPLTHSVARNGLRRRLNSIPNPTGYFVLSEVVADNWQELAKLTSRGSISRSTPRVGQPTNRAIVPSHSFDELPRIKLNIRSKSRFILKADIESCYPSIYTHSIPWAIHGKAFSKANRRARNLGNSLDELVRRTQDDQTNGLPIGPDTSFLLSEVLLSAVDEVFESRLKAVTGLRYVDDYELGFRSRQDAEAALSELGSILHDYQLRLNERKTGILELPRRIEPAWVSQLRQFSFRKGARAQATDLLTYFDLAFQLAHEDQQDEAVLNYAVARLTPHDDPQEAIHSKNWELLQDFLFQCLMVEAGTYLKVLDLLVQYHRIGYDIDLASVNEVLNALLIEQCNKGYASEIAWSLWAMIFFGLSIRPETATVISGVKDSFVALLALDAKSRGLTPPDFDVSYWESLANEQGLYDENWLLAYETNVKNWLPRSNTNDYVASDARFGYLKSEGVEFYDLSMLPTAVAAGADIDDILIAPLYEDVFY